jgi:hypothetical protein
MGMSALSGAIFNFAAIHAIGMYLERKNGFHKQLMLAGVSKFNYFLANYLVGLAQSFWQAFWVGAIFSRLPIFDMGTVLIPLLINAIAQPLSAYMWYIILRNMEQLTVERTLNFGNGVV